MSITWKSPVTPIWSRMTSRGSPRRAVPRAGVAHPEAQPGTASPSRRRAVVGVVVVAAGAAIEVVVELSDLGRSTVEEVVGAAASSPLEPPLLHPVAARALAATTAVSTRPSCRPAVFAMHRETLNHRAGLTPLTNRHRPTRPTRRPDPALHQPVATSSSAIRSRGVEDARHNCRSECHLAAHSSSVAI
jgi:hypothetical protein